MSAGSATRQIEFPKSGRTAAAWHLVVPSSVRGPHGAGGGRDPEDDLAGGSTHEIADMASTWIKEEGCYYFAGWWIPPWPKTSRGTS